MLHHRHYCSLTEAQIETERHTEGSLSVWKMSPLFSVFIKSTYKLGPFTEVKETLEQWIICPHHRSMLKCLKQTKTSLVTGGMKPTTMLGSICVSLGFPQYGQIQFGRQQEEGGGFKICFERSVRRRGLYLNGSFLTFNQRCQTYNTKKIFLKNDS